MKKLLVVEIVMTDMSYNSSTWELFEIKNFGPVELHCAGYLVEEREDCYIVAKDYNPGEQTFRHLSAIPKVNVKSIRKFRNR